jgi:hypothetical protein
MKPLIFAVVLTVIAVVSPAAHAVNAVPVRMSGTISDSPTPDPACGGLHNVSTGTIAGTPFGPSGWSSTACLDATAEPGVLTIRDATFVITSRAGKIFGSYRAHASLPSSSGHIYAWGPFTITKGTGRYSGARGSGIAASDGNITAANARLELSGSMTAPRLRG